MQRSILLTENGKCIFRYDVNPINGRDNLEKDIAQFVVQIEQKKNMINSRRVIENINRIKHFGLDSIINFFSEPANIERFVEELKVVTTEVRSDFKIRFSKENIRQKFIETLKEN